jgi:hypothetical protein
MLESGNICTIDSVIEVVIELRNSINLRSEVVGRIQSLWVVQYVTICSTVRTPTSSLHADKRLTFVGQNCPKTLFTQVFKHFLWDIRVSTELTVDTWIDTFASLMGYS